MPDANIPAGATGNDASQGRAIGINLESLLDLSAKLNSTSDVTFILNATLLSLMGKLRIFRSCVLLPDIGNSSYKVILTKGKALLERVPYFEPDSIRELDAAVAAESALIEAGFVYALPLVNQSGLDALICLGKSAEFSRLAGDEYHYARLVASIAATALQNAHINKSLANAKNSLEQQNQLLTTMFEMSNEFSALATKAQIIRMLSYRLMGQLMVSRFAAFLKNEGGHFVQIINRFDRQVDDSCITELARTSSTCLVADMKLPVAVMTELELINAVVVSPMYVAGVSKGLLIIGPRMNGAPVAAGHLQFIEALSNIAMGALENERLFNEEIEKKRLESEMKLALEIQQNLLPKIIPQPAFYEIAGRSLPARLVGGDYFDVVTLSRQRTLVVIADVSGKGMPAALLMANVQAALRVIAPLDLPLGEIISKINSIVYQNTSSDKFVTFFAGILDQPAARLSYINAGHNPPVLVRCNKELVKLTEGGIILGFSDEEFPYSQGEVSIEEDDLVVFYTDGITEAMNSSRDEYGEQRLGEIILANCRRSCEEMIDCIIDDVTRHTAAAPQFDDITLVVLKRPA